MAGLEEMNPAVEYRALNWVPAISPDRYLVGKDGSVWRRVNERWYRLSTRKLSDGSLYYFFRTNEGKVIRIRCARVILGTFVKPPSKGLEVHYLNDRKSDLALSNLRWAPLGHTRVGAKPASITRQIGSSNASAKLTDSQIYMIIKLYKHGALYRDLAEEFNVSESCIGRIIRGKSWVNITSNLYVPLRNTAVSGSFHSRAKIDESDVRRIIRLRQEGVTVKEIARLVNAPYQIVQRVIYGKAWKKESGGGFRLGSPKGVRNAAAKLSPGDVERIRLLRRTGLRFSEIARIFAVSPNTISRVIRGLSWTHIRSDIDPAQG